MQKRESINDTRSRRCLINYDDITRRRSMHSREWYIVQIRLETSHLGTVLQYLGMIEFIGWFTMIFLNDMGSKKTFLYAFSFSEILLCS